MMMHELARPVTPARATIATVADLKVHFQSRRGRVHSVDGVSAWATLVTFATVTAVTAERVVVAPGTTVRRYLRVVDDVTGAGSISRGITFARR